MQKIACFQSLINSDLTEGRGPMRHVGYFKFRPDAEDSVKGMGVMGVGNGEVKQVEVIIYDDISEFNEGRKEEIKRKALNKLSYEEKRALGLA